MPVGGMGWKRVPMPVGGWGGKECQCLWGGDGMEKSASN